MKKNNQQKGRRSDRALAQEMLELAQSGKCGVEILSTLDITVQRARALHYRLMVEKKLTVDSLSFPTQRRTSVTERGLYIPATRLASLGLQAIFSPGTPVRFSVHEHSLVIEPDLSGAKQVQKEPVETRSLLPALLDNPSADERAKGESDEPNA